MISFGSLTSHAPVVYLLLAASIGIYRCRLLRPVSRDARSIVGVLTYGAAIFFGPITGAAVGVISALTRNTHARRGKVRKLIIRGITSGIAGLAAGYLFNHLRGSMTHSTILVRTALILLPAIAVFVIMAISGLAENRKFVYRSVFMRIRANSPFALEFVLGMILMASARIMYGTTGLTYILPIVPLLYLTKYTIVEILAIIRAADTLSEEAGLIELYRSTVYSLIAAVDARDRFTRVHTNNVARLSLQIARTMNLSNTEIEGLRVAAFLHDIGKLWVPEHVLLKPGKLNPDQYAKIRHHPALGQKILEKVSFPWPVGSMIRSHHERWDGAGYPDKLKGERIPLGARILCVADVFDAMTSKRSYRGSNSQRDTINYIKSAAGSHFDPAVVRAFEEVAAEGNLPSQRPRKVNLPVQSGARHAHIRDKSASDGGLVDDISRTSREFIAIYEIAQTVSTTLDIDKLLYLLAVKIKSMISCASCVILMRDKNSDRIEVKTAQGANSQYFEAARTSIGHGPTGAVADSGQGVITSFDKHDIFMPQLAEPGIILHPWIELKSMMAVPLSTADGVIGTINLYHHEENGFTDEELRLLSAISVQAGRAIQNAILFKRTSDTAMRDIMTGLHNARYLFMRLEQELANAKRLNKPVSVLVLDLDNFKTINDTLGHQHGDLALREMSKLFLDQVRDTDIVCRYAGDEFVIILPDTNTSGALETAKRIESRVDEHRQYGNHHKKVKIGVSIGVATYPEDGSDIGSMIARADVNMYAHKERRKGKRSDTVAR